MDELNLTARRVVSAVQELEECWFRAVLRPTLQDPGIQQVLGLELIQHYQLVSFVPTDVVWPHRKRWIQLAVEEFTAYCRQPSISFSALASGKQGSFGVTIGGERVVLRLDQVFSARFWQVGINPINPNDSARLANDVIAHASKHLCSRILDINKLCREHARKPFTRLEEIRWPTSGRGLGFEHLIAGILNETEATASRASLWEDLFEWTDLRVKYPGLERNRGARVQVKLIGNEVAESERVSSRRERDVYVLVSPVQMALYVAKCLEAKQEWVEEKEFWACLDGEPADIGELAGILERMFIAVMETADPHPLGPMGRLPAVLRRIIRGHVRELAFASTDLVRMIVTERPTRPPRWVRT